MAETQKASVGHDTLQIGQRLLAALAQAEIAHLLDGLIGALSPERLENVCDQLQSDTRQTVQTILVPPDFFDSDQEKQLLMWPGPDITTAQ